MPISAVITTPFLTGAIDKQGLILLFILNCSICPAAMVPFVIPAQQDANSLIAIQNEPVGGDAFYDRIVATGDHFTRGGERIKMWGVNFSFGGNFPSHADAEVASVETSRNQFIRAWLATIFPAWFGFFYQVYLNAYAKFAGFQLAVYHICL